MIEVKHIHKIGRLFVKIKAISNFFLKVNKIVNSCHIHPECNIDGVVFTHGGIGIVLNRNVKFGKNVRIYQNVTIGNDGNNGTPIIEDNVTIYSNSVVVGNITVGKNSIIGACSFLKTSVPENTIWAGVPAKQIGIIKNDY